METYLVIKGFLYNLAALTCALWLATVIYFYKRPLLASLSKLWEMARSVRWPSLARVTFSRLATEGGHTASSQALDSQRELRQPVNTLATVEKRNRFEINRYWQSLAKAYKKQKSEKPSDVGVFLALSRLKLHAHLNPELINEYLAYEDSLKLGSPQLKQLKANKTILERWGYGQLESFSDEVQALPKVSDIDMPSLLDLLRWLDQRTTLKSVVDLDVSYFLCRTSDAVLLRAFNEELGVRLSAALLLALPSYRSSVLMSCIGKQVKKHIYSELIKESQSFTAADFTEMVTMLRELTDQRAYKVESGHLIESVKDILDRSSPDSHKILSQEIMKSDCTVWDTFYQQFIRRS